MTINRDEYHKGQVFSSMLGVGFYSLLAALFREADSENLEVLKDAFPGEYEKLVERYNAPHAMLPGETAVIAGTKMYRELEEPYNIIKESSSD